MSNLEYYDKYWRHTSSDPTKERRRLGKDGVGKAGGPIGAQTAMVQDKMLKNLKTLFDEAGIDDWVSMVDHTITYQSQKDQIISRYGGTGFGVDREKRIRELEAHQKHLEAEAPEDAPTSLHEQLKRERFGEKDDQFSNEDAEVEIIGDSKENSTSPEPRQPNTNHHSLTEAQEKCVNSIKESYKGEEDIIIDALPGMGKTHGAIKATDETEIQITILVGRGNNGQYQEVQGWCEDYGLSYKQLPSSYRDCPTISGEKGGQLAREQKTYMKYGLTAGTLHQFQDLPCEENGPCSYLDSWNFEPNDFDVLIGHYLHAHVPKVTENRTVVFDEFPGDVFITKLDSEQNITEFLKECNGIPFSNYVDLLSNRNDRERRSAALNWYENRGFGLEEIAPVFYNDSGTRHALAPLGVLALLQTGELGNGWESGPLREGEWAVVNQEDNIIYLLRPPALSQANCTIGLSGTPIYRFWELVLGIDFDVNRVLSNKERRDYIRDSQNLHIIQTEDKYTHPYSSGYHSDSERDAALIEEIHRKHGTVPAVITSGEVLKQIRQENVQIDSDSAYYGNIRGSNSLAKKDVGLILGSPHPGDKEIKKWAAFFGEAATRSGSGANLSYGPFGDRVLKHLRENEVLQAIFRFARDGSGATVYVNTAAIPRWLPRQWAIGVHRKRIDTELRVIEALLDLGKGSGSEIAKEANVHPNTARDHLRRLEKERAVRKTGKTRSTEWHDESLSSINEYGFVDLAPLTEPVHNISIGDLGEKLNEEEYALSEQERTREILENAIEELRDPNK